MWGNNRGNNRYHRDPHQTGFSGRDTQGIIERMMTKTTDEFIAECQAKHGNRFDYAQTEYTHSHTPITVSCTRCGTTFQVRPNNHLSRGGCRTCADATRRARLSKTTAEFIRDARARHGDTYDYSDTVYTNYRTQVTIRCPVHGPWSAWPSNHTRTQAHGCPVCARQR